MKERKSAIYLLGNLKLKGFVEEAGDGLYWFNTEERIKLNKRALLVSASDLKIVVK